MIAVCISKKFHPLSVQTRIVQKENIDKMNWDVHKTFNWTIYVYNFSTLNFNINIISMIYKLMKISSYIMYTVQQTLLKLIKCTCLSNKLILYLTK